MTELKTNKDFRKEGLKLITSQKEYWEKHKEYMKRLTKLTKRLMSYIDAPKDYQNEFENLLGEMAFVGVISEEHKHRKIKQFYEKITAPQRYKEKMKEKALNLKKKYKNKIKEFIKGKKKIDIQKSSQ